MGWLAAVSSVAALLTGVPLGTTGDADAAPRLSHDGSAIVFWSARGGGTLRVIRPDGSAERVIGRVEPGGAFALSPDWRWLAVSERYGAGVAVMRPEGLERRVVATGEIYEIEFAPTGDELAFASREGVFAVAVDGTNLRRLADRGRIPRWSPDGRLVAYADGLEVLVVPSAGGEARTLFSGFFVAPLDLSWSPAGHVLAIAVAGSLAFAPLDGGYTWWYPLAATGPGHIAWEPGLNTVAWGGEDFLVRVDPGTGRAVRFETEAWDPSWSADARALVFAARGECKQIYGIYRIEADGSDLRRLTNGCRVVGTAGADALHGSPRVDVLVGGPGNDRLRAVDQPLTGDDLFGGPGDDVLNGGEWANRIEGGPGRDRLWGAMGADVLIGGQGPDALHAGFGDDALVTADGAPDRLECGLGALDVAAADRFDVVSRDCEVAIRMRPVTADRAVALRVLYWPLGPSGPRRRFTLSCEPPAGTHPKPSPACAALAAVIDPFRPFADGVRTPCKVLEQRDPHTAQVDGVYRGRPVHTVFQRLDTCSLQRWNRVGRFLAELPFAP